MKASKKLIGASVALVAALAVSVGSTFAWFTTNKNVTVDGISANVTTGDSNLEVALVGTDGEVGKFGYNLNLSEALKDMFDHTEFDALTDNGALQTDTWAGNGTNGATLTDKTGTAAVVASQASGGGAWTTGNYITFTLRFRTTSSDEDAATSGIKLNLSDSVNKSFVNSTKGAKAPKIYAWEDDIAGDTSIAIGNEISADAKDAIRVAFHEATVTEPKTGEGDSGNTAGKVEVVKTNGVVWNPNAGLGFSATKYGTKNMAQIIEEHLTGAEADSLSGLYKDPAYTDITTKNYLVATMTQKGEYYIADVQVTIWLEGTDADCFNNLFSDTVVISLGFEIGEDD